MKRLSILIQWLLVLGFLGFVGYALLKAKPVPDRQPDSWRSWQGFMALSYPGIGTGDPAVYTSPEMLQEQLEALKAAGYHTITPEDALAYLQEGAPLPDKALILLFEGGRKDSVIYTVKPFQQTGFIGTLCLPTRMLHTRGSFFLRRGDFRRISGAGFWQFAGMGHEAVDEIPTGDQGETGHFLTRRKWVDGELERPEAYEQRVADDYSGCIEDIEKATGTHPIAYIYPFADAGRGREADPEAQRINREQVTHHFQMAFVHADNPFNGPGRNPFDLTRLRVAGNISGKDLIEELNRYLPTYEIIDTLHTPESWQTIGDVSFTNNVLKMGDGATTWIRGSDHWSDVDLTTTLQIQSDSQAALYVRYASQESFLRVTVTADGIRVQENLQARMQTLHWEPRTLQADTPVSLRLLVKGSRVWLWLGEEPLAGPLPLSSLTRQGRVGFGSDIGPFCVDALVAIPLQTVYAVASQLESFSKEDHQQLKALIIPLASVSKEPALEQRRAILGAASQGTEVIPLLPGDDTLSEALDNLFVLLDHPITRSLITRVALPTPSSASLTRLHENELNVVAVLSPKEILQKQFDPAVLQVEDMILLSGSEEQSLSAIDHLLSTYPAYRIIGFLDDATCLQLGVSQAVRTQTTPE